MARLDNESNVNVGRYHLEIHFFAGRFAAEKGLSRKHLVDNCRSVIAVVLHGYPIADARQFNRGFNLEIELPGDFRGDFLGLISDEV